MDITNILFTSAVTLWFLAIVILITIQQSMKATHGVYSSMKIKLNEKQLKRAKVSAFVFVCGTVLLITGFALR